MSNAFSKSKTRIKPGIFLLAVKLMMLSIRRMFSPINLPLINPVLVAVEEFLESSLDSICEGQLREKLIDALKSKKEQYGKKTI